MAHASARLASEQQGGARDEERAAEEEKQPKNEGRGEEDGVWEAADEGARESTLRGSR